MDEPHTLTDVLSSPSYSKLPFEDRMKVLDQNETDNLKFLQNQHTNNPTDDPKDAMLYADGVQEYRSATQMARLQAIQNETKNRLQQHAEMLDMPVDQVRDQVFDMNKKVEELPAEIQPLRGWLDKVNQEHVKRTGDSGFSPVSNALILTNHGAHAGEMNTFRDGKGDGYAAISFAQDEDGQAVADDKRSKDVTIPLKTDLPEAITKLEKDKVKQMELLQQAKKDLEEKKRIIPDDSEGKWGALQEESLRIQAANKELITINGKLDRYHDSYTGMTAYMQDQAGEKMRQDPNLLKHFPTGGNILPQWLKPFSPISYTPGVDRFVTDSVAGIVQSDYEIAAAGKLVTGDKEGAKSLLDQAQEMDIAREVTGMGQTRQKSDMFAHGMMLTSDLAPTMLGQMAVGRLIGAATEKLVVKSMLKTATGEAVEGVLGKEALAVVGKRWGNSVGSFVGAMPMSAQMAASNLGIAFDKVDQLEAEAKNLTGGQKEAKLKEAQQIDDNATQIFAAHFISAQGLQMLPLHHLLTRAGAADLTLAQKLVRNSLPMEGVTAAERTAEAVKRASALEAKQESYLVSKLGPRNMEAITQGSAQAITMATMTMSDNNIAQQFYDENRDLTEGMGPSALSGLFIGGLMGFMQRHAPKSSLKSILDSHETATAQASKNAQAQLRNIIGQSLEDGTVAHPVSEVTKQRKDGKWIVDDPDMPNDAAPSPEFDTPEQAAEYANKRWERYGHQRITEIMGLTDNTQKGEVDPVLATMSHVVERAMVDGAANGASTETIWKSLSQSVQFRDALSANDVPAMGDATHEEVITEIKDSLNRNPNAKLQKQLETHLQELQSWNTSTDPDKGAPPVPEAELAIAISSIAKLKSATNSALGVNYPNIESAHHNILEAIPNMATEQLGKDLVARMKRFNRVIEDEKTQGETPNSRKAKMAMIREQQAVLFELTKRKANATPPNQAAGEGTPQDSAQVSNQASTESGSIAPRGGEGNAQAGEKVKSLPDLAQRMGLPITAAEIQVLVRSAKAEFPNEHITSDPVTGHNTTGTGLMDILESEGKPRMGKEFSERRGYTPEQIRDWNKRSAIIDKLLKQGFKEDDVSFFEGVASGQLQFPAELNQSAPAPHFPKEIETFMTEMQGKIDAYNKALLGQPEATTKAPKPPETATVGEIIGDPVTGAPKGHWATIDEGGQTIPIQLPERTAKQKTQQAARVASTGAKPPMESAALGEQKRTPIKGKVVWVTGASPEDIAANRSKGTGVEAPSNIVNQDGTVNLDRLLSSVPKGTPLGDLAEILQEVLPLLHPEDKRAKFLLSKDPASVGVTNNAGNGSVVVGDGPAGLDTISLNATLPEVLGAVLPRMVDIILDPKVLSLKANLLKNNQLSEANPLTQWRGGKFAHERNSPSALAMRAMFHMAVADSSPKSADEMRRVLVRAELSRVLTKLPASNRVMDAMADGNAEIGAEPPKQESPYSVYVQKTADGGYTFFERKTPQDKWGRVEQTWEPKDREKFDRSSPESKLALLYLRAVMAGGHFGNLFGRQSVNPDGTPTLIDGLADTPLSKAEYNQKYGRFGKKAPPYELTSLSRFVSGMLSNPNFSMLQDSGGGWVQPFPVRKGTFQVVINNMLGGKAKATDGDHADAIVGAAMLASNAKKTRQSLKQGIPEPSPVRSTVDAHQRKIVESQAEGASYGGQRQNALGATPVQLDEAGRPTEGDQPGYEKEAHEFGGAIQPSMRVNPATGKPAQEAGTYTEERGRADQAKEFSEVGKFRGEEATQEEMADLTADTLTEAEANEVHARIVTDSDNHFAAQLEAAQRRGLIPSHENTTHGRDAEEILGIFLKRQKLDKKLGEAYDPEDSPSTMLNKLVQQTNVSKSDMDALLKQLAKYLPEKDVESIGAEWHKNQLASPEYKAKEKAAVNKVYEDYNADKKGKKLNKSQREEVKGMAEEARVLTRREITPTGFEPKLGIKPFNEVFGDKVDTSGQDEGSGHISPVGKPLVSAKNAEVLVNSMDAAYPEKALRDYVYSFSDQRQAQTHTALVQLAKIFGIKLSEKDTFKNSLKEVRIRPDSLGAWGNLEAILHGLTDTSNPIALDDALKAALPSVGGMKKFMTALKADPTLLRDMHAMASSFVDKIAYDMTQQGKVVMSKEDALIAGQGEKVNDEGINDPHGDRKGEKAVEPEEVAGPFVAIDADTLTGDLENQSKAEPREFKPKTERSFKLRPSRFNPRGSGAEAVHENGIVPFYKDANGNEVPLHGDLPMSALGGRTVNAVYRELADQLDANASTQKLQSIYKDVWRQALTTNERGMKALEDIKAKTEASRKKTGKETPLVSPEVSDNMAVSPAKAISELANDYLPKNSLEQTPKNMNRRGFINTMTRMITVLKNGDPTTLIHEFVHWTRFTKLKNGQSLFEQALGNHYDEFMKWATEDGKHSLDSKEGRTMIEERIASGAEQFLRRAHPENINKDTGEVRAKMFWDKLEQSSPRLVEAFKKVANMMRRIYGSIKGFVKLDSRALNGYDEFFGAKELITPSFNKEIALRPINPDLSATAQRIAKIKADAKRLTGQEPSEELAQQVVREETELKGSELMPIPEPGEPKTPDDPETMLYQSLPGGWTPPAGSMNKPTFFEGVKGQLKVLYRKGEAGFIDWVLATGGVPWKAFEIMKIHRGGYTQSFQRTMLKNSQELIKSIQGHLKATTGFGYERSISREQLHRDVNAYLTEADPVNQANLLMNLPSEKIKDAAVAMRVHVENVMQEMVAQGVVTGRIAGVVDAQKGFFLHRMYDIAGDEGRRERLLTGDLHLLYLKALDSIKLNRGYDDTMAKELAAKIIDAGDQTKVVKQGDPRAAGVGVLRDFTKQRDFEDVAEARDLLWGLKQDPILNYQKTVEQMGQLIVAHQTMNELLHWGTQGPNPAILPDTAPRRAGDVAITTFFNDPKPGDFAKDPIGANTKTILAGWRTTPEIAKFVSSIYEDLQSVPRVHRHAMNLVNQLNGMFKMAQTVGNWRTGARNLYTSTLSSLANGHLNPVHLATASKLIFKEGFGKDQGAHEALVQELMRNNILESATLAELRDYSKHAYSSDLAFEDMTRESFLSGDGNPSPTKRFMSEVGMKLGRGGALGTLKRFHVGMYNGMDTMAKVASYLGEKDSVRKMRPAMNEADLQSEAARRTHLTMFSFDMTPKLLNVFRKNLPFSGPFISFGWAMMRTSVNIVKLGVNDVMEGMKRAKAGEQGGSKQVQAGIGRLAAYGVVAASGEMVAKHMASILGWDDKDMEAMRAIVPPWDRRGNLMVFSSPSEKKLSYVNLSGMLPYSVVADTVMSAFRGDEKTAMEKLGNGALTMAQPFLEDQYLFTAYRALADFRDEQGNPLLYESASFNDKVMAAATELVRPLVPGSVTNLGRMDLLPEGDLRNRVGTAMENMHIKTKPMTPWEKTVYGFGVTYNKIDKNAAYQFEANKWVEAVRGSTNQFVKMAASTNPLTRDALEKAFNNAKEVSKTTVSKAHDFTRVMKTHFLLSDKEVDDMLDRAQQHQGDVSGGHFNEEHKTGITRDKLIPGTVFVSEERWNAILDNAQATQPERAIWLETMKDNGLKVTTRKGSK